jgi:hypothetical protein
MGTEGEPIDISSSSEFSSENETDISSSEFSSENETIYEYDSDMPAPKRGEFTLRGISYNLSPCCNYHCKC